MAANAAANTSVIMAAHSDGMDWPMLLKPFLATENDSNKHYEIIELCQAIAKSAENILRNPKVDPTLLNNFIITAVDYINNSIDQVPTGQVAAVTEGTSVLLQYLVAFLRSDSGQSSIEHGLKALQTLCHGDSLLNESEYAALLSKIKATVPSKDAELSTVVDKESSSKSEASKGRSDLSATILEQLIVPIKDNKGKDDAASEPPNAACTTAATEHSELTSDVTKAIFKRNTEILQSLKAGEMLLELCLKLPTIKKANSKIEEAISGKNFNVPVNHNEAVAVKNSLHATLTDVSLVSLCLRLRLLEPLSPAKLISLHRLCMALLYHTVTQTAASAILGLLTTSSSSAGGGIAAASTGTTAPIVGTASGAGNTSGGSKSGSKDAGEKVEADKDDKEVVLIEVVLGLYGYVGEVIKLSTRAGGNVYQNHLLSGAWVLISGLQAHIASCCNQSATSTPSSTTNTPRSATTTEESPNRTPAVIETTKSTTTTRSPSKNRLLTADTTTTAAAAGGPTARSWLIKFQQSFGVLSVALVDKAITLMSELFEDMQVEIVEGGTAIVQVDPATLNSPLSTTTALQRIARLLTSAPLNQLLFYITIVSYRKACSLKRIRVGATNDAAGAGGGTGGTGGGPGDTGSQSDSTTYFDDMIMCSDDSSTEEEEEEDDGEEGSEEEDSEPILGLWFEETFSAPPGESKDSKNSSITENPDVKPAQHERNASIVPDKGEAHGFIALSTNIFVFMNKYLLGTKSDYVTNYVQNGLAEQQVLILASIIKDLDRETARTEVVTINRYFGAALGQLYCDFSGALARFSHNLITHKSLQHLQAGLLSHLGVSPWNKDQPHGWPLQVYPRTLAVLAQTLLQRPSNEKEASVIGIWHRVVNTLIDNVVNVQQAPQDQQSLVEHEDLNVEHAQVLLYLFHSLNLMQKKSVVLLMAGGILRCSEIGRSSEIKELQLLYLSRVLLLFDYIMKHLYDAPQQLLEQIQWNLFHSTNLKTDSTSSDNMLTKMFTPWSDIEKCYRLKNVADEFVSMKPRFYIVTNVEVNNQETPKLDGLACNFILGTPDKLRYPLLLDALIEILNITKFCAVKQLSFLGLCAVQYCFSICWRLLLLLPPSNTYIERLTSTEQQIVPGPLLLHSLVWGARTNHKNFSRWLKDCLVKQGVYTQQTERMLKSASDAINNLKYDVTNAKNCILALTPDVKNGCPMTHDKLPPLWHVILIDSVIAKMQLSLIDETETNTADAAGNTVSGSVYVRDLMPNILKLAKAILHQIRWSLLNNMMVGTASTTNPFQSTADEIEDILAVASAKNGLTATLTSDLITMLPSSVPYVLQGWNRSMLEECSMTPFLNDIIPSESYILKIVETHIGTLTLENTFSINFSLKRLLFSLTKFICQHVAKIENTDTKRIAINYLVQITLDVRTEYIYDSVCKVLDKLIGDSETDKHQIQVYLQVLKSTYRTITNYVKTPNDLINEKIMHNILKFYEKMLEKPTGRQAMEAFFTGDRDLVEILMSVGNSHISSQYSARILHFFNRMFFCADKWPTDTSLNYLCGSLSKIAKVDSLRLQAWLKHIIIGATSDSGLNVPVDMDVIPSDSKETEDKQATYESNASISSPAVTTVVCLDDQQRSLSLENTQLLQALTNFFVKQNVANPISEEISLTILKAMITLVMQSLNATLEGTTFTDLISVMTTLADAGVGRGHVYLFPAMAEWLDECRKYLIDSKNGDIADDKSKLRLDASGSMVEYLSDVLAGLQNHTAFRSLSPPWEGEMPLEQDSDWLIEDAENDDDSGEDSDEDSLCNKICTFTVTHKEFMNQHWYNCHTCRMLDGVGVCSICARVCHRGHDLSYAKYGNFFCDCGAKEDRSCQALVRRTAQSNQQPNNEQAATSSSSVATIEQTAKRNKAQEPSEPSQQACADSRTGTLSKGSASKGASTRVKQFEGCRQWILNFLGYNCLSVTLLQLLKTLLPAVEVTCSRNSPVGCHARAMRALNQLHQSHKKYVTTDQLMVPTLGSQEGAFENVRMNYTGEQGQTIRQLLSAHIVRRVAMCCTASTHGRRQHLAVAHEKGKITILQLSTLLRQADSSNRKLTLTRLSTAPIPFTVLTLAANHCNEDFLSVCGLKECHVLTFNANGTVIDHLVLHPQLETGNFIIKSMWLPGSQTCLALITADFVKIYDLSKDALSPQYYFLVPSGKIRDCTFMYDDGVYTILLMSSPGHIYTELLNEDSSAKHGSFYVTNTLEVFHLDVTDVNGQVAGGGVSIYYSHTLRLLFYSYAQGKSFISPLMPKSNCLTVVFPITLSAAPPTAKNNGGGGGGGGGGGKASAAAAAASATINPQSLCSWMEVPNHPGLICCSMQSSNNPVIIMLNPNSISIQEMKIIQSKSTKIMDMVAIRHNSTSTPNSELRTTLILLCEDGSLKIYMANMENTGYWLQPSMQPSVVTQSSQIMMKGGCGGGGRKGKTGAKGKGKGLVGGGGSGGGAVGGLSVDFFEHCQPMNDVELGGNDLLQIYNAAQLKHRLNTKGLYIACTRTLGFTVEITNGDAGMVMCGVRVLVGSQEPQRAPSYIEVFGRAINVNVTRSRWYDVPFTREESLQADRRLNVVFGPSQDPDTSVTMVDSIKVFGKTKEAFGWPEEIDEPMSGASLAAMSSANVYNDVEHVSSSTKVISLSKLEKLVTGVLEILDGTFLLYGNDDKLSEHKSECITIATQLLTLPIPPALQVHSTDLLSSLHSTKQQYHAYKDQALLQHVLTSLSAMSELDASATDGSGDIDAESYYRLVMIVRAVAAARPLNLIKFSEAQTPIQSANIDDPLDDSSTKTRSAVKNNHLLLQLMDVLWLLHAANPENPALAPVVGPGLKHTEQVIFALVEIIHAFNTSDTYSSISLGVYMQLLLCKDSVIAFSARYALSRVLRPRYKRRKVFIPSPAQCATPPSKTSVESEEDNKAAASSSGSHRGTAGPSSRHHPDQITVRDAVNALVRYQDEQRIAGPQIVADGGAPLAAAANAAVAAVVNPIEALLAGAVGGPGSGGGASAAFQNLLDIPPDADDETMVEIAIALSLQEQDGDQAAALGGIHQVRDMMLSNPLLNQIAQGHLQGAEGGHFSDTTASAGGSDDEGSTAATDGSTLRTSPAEQGGSAGSESGGSGVESITGDHNVSGRSSAYGDNIQEAISIVSRSENSIATTNYQAGETDANQPETDDSENAPRLHLLRLQLLEKMICYLPKLRNVSGLRSIPFFQVILQLTSDLDGNSERDRAGLNNLLTALITELDMLKPDFNALCARTEQREVQLVILRLLSVILSRTKSLPPPSAATTTKGVPPPPSPTSASILFVATTTATHLYRAGFIPYCLGVLRAQLAHWRRQTTGDDGQSGSGTNAPHVVGGNLLKEFQSHTPPDLSPFFLRQFVKGHASDIFATYNQLVIEVALRLPYQIYRQTQTVQPMTTTVEPQPSTSVSSNQQQAFTQEWFGLLCEYMMCSTQGNSVRRQVRKLLLFIAGGKDQYRQTRDIHAIEAHIKAVKLHCTKGGFDPTTTCQQYVSLPYDTLVEMVEHLKACLEIALSRVGNWQKFCLENCDVIPLLFQVSCFLDEGVAPNILQLLNCAVVASNRKQETSKAMSRKDRERSDDSATEAAFDDGICIKLIDCINKNVCEENLIRFIKTFILETNTSAVRWQAHNLLLAMYQNSNLEHQEALLNILWKLWPSLPAYGRKATQYVDLLGFFTLRASQNPNSKAEISSFIDQAVNILQVQNDLISHHPNANLYSYLAQYVDIEGYYLEAEPCLVCNNPEIQLATIKLNSIKVDSKYTTTTQIMKLVNSHTISRITIRIADLKRTKMVRCIQIYYNNRNVQAIVELKNKPALWHKAKKVTIPSGQTEVKIEFPLPIVACNLMVEYSDFYENVQASTETHQCPRCSAAVPANPGVCSNCGENVFQCHKCRAINYDEKDPFLCHSCGFCKYAKFDFTLLAKPCCAVEPIDNDEDRKKMVGNINMALEKADRVYKQLMANKPCLENLLIKVSECSTDRKIDEPATLQSGNAAQTAASVVNSSAANSGHQNKINKSIQVLAQQYGSECKTSFEELSRIIQKVLISRKELLAYDRRQTGNATVFPLTSEQVFEPRVRIRGSQCYGCSSAATDHCLTLLRSMALHPDTRLELCKKGLIQELLKNNLRRGNTQTQEDVRHLISTLNHNNPTSTFSTCALLTSLITSRLSNSPSDLRCRPEVALLASLQRLHDTLWSVRLRCLVRLYLRTVRKADVRNPVVTDAVLLPCLRMWCEMCAASAAAGTAEEQAAVGSKKAAKEKSNTSTAASVIKQGGDPAPVNISKWISKESHYEDWHDKLSAANKGTHAPTSKSKTKEQMRRNYLMEKYGLRWRERVLPLPPPPFTDEMCEATWVKTLMFNQSSRPTRQVICNIMEQCCTGYKRKRKILCILTNYLDEVSVAGEHASEFLSLYQNLISEYGWKQYLTVHGVLYSLADLITSEIDQLHCLEQTSLTSNLTQGYALSRLTDLLASFLVNPAIRRRHKGRLVAAVLNGYLALRRLVVQRTRIIDDTQEKLLELLEVMTTGNEEETKAYMSVCINAVDKCSLHDYQTPVFIFERLCNIIYPEESDAGEFFLTLEKDPQQEDFLQGRMLGNPYSSGEAGLGPLMRDVKNKICQDCELVALLEDDNGMELLVNNKIMSLDLPVKDVYKKVWLAEGGDADSMRVIYRMRGLLGDATEEFVETLANKAQATVDNEEVYKMANVLTDCDGLQVMLTRLGAIQNLARARPLLQVLLKLFRLSVKVVRVQDVLIQPPLAAMTVFLRTLKLCLDPPITAQSSSSDSNPPSSQSTTTEQLLDIMETILSRATAQPLEQFKRFAKTCGGAEYVRSLLGCVNQTGVRRNAGVLVHLARVLAGMVYCSEEKTKILLDHFRPVFDFNLFDFEATTADQQRLEMFCVLTQGIERNVIGNTLKDDIIALGLVREALEYIGMHAPCVKPTLLRTDSDELKEFITKPALKYILRLLAGLAYEHENTQLAIAAADTIPIIHRLEQVSSDEHVGTLAENLLEALRTNPAVASKIEEVREFTRSEKKRLAMAMREKQLGQLGMRTNDKGQVTAKSIHLQQMEELGEETGLVCCICREGYKYQPSKVLAIYTFTKRCNIEDYEAKPRKTMGYSTVTHFNIVHVDCHMSAVRLARARDEWESAALQNASTKCNGLLPLWGPQVAESAFASCLARHNAYLQESTGHRDVGHDARSSVHDLKLLLLRFAQERSFHEDTGGGGPQSNLHMVPYLIHMALYVINTTRVSKKEDAALSAYLSITNLDRCIESAFEADGPLYWITLSLLLQSNQRWQIGRLAHLRRLLIMAHARACTPNGQGLNTFMGNQDYLMLRPYAAYKPYLVYYALIDGIYRHFFKNVTGLDEQWSSNLADYIRHNDEQLLKASERLLETYTEEIGPCTTFTEFCDVAGLLDVIEDPEKYLNDLLHEV